jgi:methyl-accepting chemotaxis protein
MFASLTYTRKIVLGFSAMVAICLAVCLAAVLTLQAVAGAKDLLLSTHVATMMEAQRLQALVAQHVATNRGYYLGGEERFLKDAREEDAKLEAALAQMAAKVAGTDEQPLVEALQRTSREWRDASSEVIQLRKGTTTVDPVGKVFDERIAPRARAMNEVLAKLVAEEAANLEEGRQAANGTTARATWLMGAIGLFGLIAAAAMGTSIARGLARQIGGAIMNLRSSSVELQAAANQHVAGASEQANAMNEVTTTMNELQVTSAQIAESAQRVAHMASETAASARAGGQTVARGQEAMGLIRARMDQIVQHMLELGKKSQQIGSVLNLTSELADQTNILAINASVEAASAGDAGRRFAAVAEEIRKLADRVSDSTNEIRELVDDVRASTNTTVMATEDGAKAVDLGSREIAELAESFGIIAKLVVTTAEAVREIELSTKQQTTAVSQVHQAIAEAAQSAKESEAGSRQTLETSVMLTDLSVELSALVQAAQPGPVRA